MRGKRPLATKISQLRIIVVMLSLSYLQVSCDLNFAQSTVDPVV
jgi:hypothetical protein